MARPSFSRGIVPCVLPEPPQGQLLTTLSVKSRPVQSHVYVSDRPLEFQHEGQVEVAPIWFLMRTQQESRNLVLLVNLRQTLSYKSLPPN